MTNVSRKAETIQKGFPCSPYVYEENAAESDPRGPVADFEGQPAAPLEFGDDRLRAQKVCHAPRREGKADD